MRRILFEESEFWSIKNMFSLFSARNMASAIYRCTLTISTYLFLYRKCHGILSCDIKMKCCQKINLSVFDHWLLGHASAEFSGAASLFIVVSGSWSGACTHWWTENYHLTQGYRHSGKLYRNFQLLILIRTVLLKASKHAGATEGKVTKRKYTLLCRTVGVCGNCQGSIGIIFLLWKHKHKIW